MSDAQEIKKNQRGGFRAGAGRPKGSSAARSKTQQERDTLAALRIEQLLDDAREGKVQLDPSKLKAMELRYSRLRPMLSAIEQTVTDQRDTKDPAEIEAKLRAMYDAHPELFAFIQAKAPQQTLDTPSEPHTTH